MSFANLGVSEEILKALDENNISTPTEIQTEVIPYLLKNSKNVLAISQTGTGKTAAFGLPILQQINPQLLQTQALVLVPTRELGQQVAKELFALSRYIVRIHTEAVFGGKKIENHIEKLNTPKHIIVATPGRLLDLLQRKVIDLSHLKYLVLDEADIMLNMGFISDIEQIIKQCPPKTQKLLFTSTLPELIKKVIKAYWGSEVKEFNIKPEELINKNIQNQYIVYKFGYKFEYLKEFLFQNSDKRGIVFCRTQAAAKLLSQQLAGFEIKSGCLYGKLSQYDRNKTINAFKLKQTQLLIATDIAARGIDIPDIQFIIHYHLPHNTEQYVNRSGRTARANKTGFAISMLQEDEVSTKEVFENELNIQFEEIKFNPQIDKIQNDAKTAFHINIGTRHEITRKNILDFLHEETGIKKEAFSEIRVGIAQSSLIVDSKYEGQLYHNLHNTKHFHQKIEIEILGNNNL